MIFKEANRQIQKYHFTTSLWWCLSRSSRSGYSPHSPSATQTRRSPEPATPGSPPCQQSLGCPAPTFQCRWTRARSCTWNETYSVAGKIRLLKACPSKRPTNFEQLDLHVYREPVKGLQILLGRTQAGPGRAVKQGQEQTSCNHVQAF